MGFTVLTFGGAGALAVDAEAAAMLAAALAAPIAPAVFELGAIIIPDEGAALVADDADGVPPGSIPSSFGLRQMITAMPHAVTRSSIAMNATSFCFVDGPRWRTTMVFVLARRGFTGRSGIRIVSCGALLR